jgi:hypothetical protein
MSQRTRAEIVKIARTVSTNKPLTTSEVTKLLQFEYEEKETGVVKLLKQISLPLSILFGISLAVFPEFAEELAKSIPALDLSERALAGLDYIWGILGSAVEKPNLIYHIPNIVLYSFGVLGLQAIFTALRHRSWLDQVVNAQAKLRQQIESGEVKLAMPAGHSILFIGNGDFIGEEFQRRNPDNCVMVAGRKQSYTNIWNYYNYSNSYESLKQCLQNSSIATAGEYMFFPVTDNELFLSGPDDYDLAPHQIEITIQSIRAIEKELGLEPRRVIIVGDRDQKTEFRTASSDGGISGESEAVSLATIANKHARVIVLDPTELVMEQLVARANGREILFRASTNGLSKYSQRFYNRLYQLGYYTRTVDEAKLTVGYDLFEDMTEHQSISNLAKSYCPIVLSRQVYDALLRVDFNAKDIIFVPDVILERLATVASEQ